jgi:hypothetical protein
MERLPIDSVAILNETVKNLVLKVLMLERKVEALKQSLEKGTIIPNDKV